ncbi:MAG: nucleotide exchange factor GrpE, partial [Proteobacteria bacterium]|nr:nucleotide exchange factor GrpE [Pseudomonadota bacterium]
MHDNDSQQQQDKNPEPGDPSEDVEDARPEAAAAEPDPGAQIAELKDQLLRALAEIENVRRRGEKERADASRYAIASFARDILAVADNLQRTLDAGREGGGLEALLEAVDMTDRDLKATLERNGIKAISPLGEKFDHNFHQAMFESPGTGKPAGTVVQVLQTGYVIA